MNNKEVIMIEEMGQIVNIKKNKFIEVMILDPDSSSCESCVNKHFCSIQGKILKIPFFEGFNKQDVVKVKMENMSILKATALVYGIPLIMLILGIFTGYYIFFNKYSESLKSLYSFILSMILLVVSGFIVYFIDKKYHNKIKYNIEKINFQIK